MADIIDKARIIVKDNKLQDKVTLIKSKVEEAVLPVEQVSDPSLSLSLGVCV